MPRYQLSGITCLSKAPRSIYFEAADARHRPSAIDYFDLTPCAYAVEKSLRHFAFMFDTRRLIEESLSFPTYMYGRGTERPPTWQECAHNIVLPNAHFIMIYICNESTREMIPSDSQKNARSLSQQAYDAIERQRRSPQYLCYSKVIAFIISRRGMIL